MFIFFIFQAVLLALLSQVDNVAILASAPFLILVINHQDLLKAQR